MTHGPSPELDSITHLFVYGTLRPGDVRWHFLAPFVVDEGWDDTTGGVVGGEYRRIGITTGRGTQAWAYQYGTGLNLTPIESGDWFRR